MIFVYVYTPGTLCYFKWAYCISELFYSLCVYVYVYLALCCCCAGNVRVREKNDLLVAGIELGYPPRAPPDDDDFIIN